jgi:hypothetical protein
MAHAVIPALLRFDGGAEFAFHAGTPITYADSDVAPIVERFCSEVTRRTGLRVTFVVGDSRAAVPSIAVDIASDDELDRLPAPLGISPEGDEAPDERHSLTAIDIGSPYGRQNPSVSHGP